MLITILVFFGVLGILILAHEFGHFLAAKKFGMEVQEFGFFYPPRLFKIKRGKTVYSINLIPLGGFVKIKGEDGEARQDPKSFASKPAWQRAITLAAGVLMNFLLAFFLIAIGYMIGLPSLVDDQTVGRIRDPKVQIIEIAPDSPAQAVNLEIGDIIRKVNDVEIFESEQVLVALDAARGEETVLTIERLQEMITIQVVPRTTPPEGEGPLGVALVKTAIVSYGPLKAIAEGFLDAIYAVKFIAQAFYQILRDIILAGRVSPDLSGPVGVAVMTGKVARLGLNYIIQFTAILSINLMIINSFPFPALDGGRLLFLGIESILRRPLNQRIERWVNTFGFALLLLLLAMVTFRDVFRFGVIDKIKSFF